MMIEEHRGGIDAVEQVLDVVLRAAQLLDLGVQLAIHHERFFVQRLQLFPGRFQFFIGGLELFVGRLQLLVGRFEFLAGGLQFCDGGLQAFPAVGKRLLQFPDAHRFGRRWTFLAEAFAPALFGGGLVRGRAGLGDVLETHQQLRLAGLGAGGCMLTRQPPHAEAHLGETAIGIHRDFPVECRRPFVRRTEDSHVQGRFESLARHLDHIVAGRAWGRAQVSAGVAMHEEDVAPGVGGYRGRRVVLQQHALTQFADATCAAGFRSADHRRSRQPPTFPGALNPLGANCGVFGCTRMYGPVELPLAIDRRKQLRVVGDALRCGQEQ